MGYTHYWNHSGFTSEQWRSIAAHARNLLDTTAIPLVGAMREENAHPDINEAYIIFNGEGAEGGHEPFMLAREPTEFDFCKTACKPYDVLVGAILAYAAQIAPETFATSNDGSRTYPIVP